MKYKYIIPKDWKFYYQLNWEFWLFWEHAFEVWNRYEDVKELFKNECDVYTTEFVKKVKNRVKYYIKIKKTNEVLDFFNFIEEKWENPLEKLLYTYVEKKWTIIISDTNRGINIIERAITLYLKETWIMINLQKRNIIAMSIGFFEWNEKEILYSYLDELNIDYISYKYWYNFFIDIFIEK